MTDGASKTPPSLEDLLKSDAEALWTVLTREPGVGVAVVASDSTVRYANAEARRMVNDDDCFDPVGMQIEEFADAEVAAERTVIIQRALATKRPVILRYIWSGRQQQTTIWPASAVEPEADEVLLIIREGSADACDDCFDVLESEHVNLGPLDVLTTRELEVLALIGHGLRVPEIAEVIHRSVKTVEGHRTSIAAKLGGKSTAQLIQLAGSAGLEVSDAHLNRVQ